MEQKFIRKPMLATGYSEDKVKFPCMVEPKYDGVRCLICLIGGEVHLLSRTGKEYNVPHISRWANEHKECLPLDGEIYNHQDLTFQQICSAVKCYSPMTEQLKFVVYDTPINGYTNGMRRMLLQRVFKNHVSVADPTWLSMNKVAHSDEEIQKLHDYYVSLGYEGAIIRNMDGKYVEGRSNNLMKLKRFDTTEFEVADVVEAAGQDKGTALFVLTTPDGNHFSARPTGPKSLRAAYLRDRDSLIGKQCTIRHFGYTDGGVIPRFPVALGIRDYE